MMDKPQPPGLDDFLAFARAHVQAQEDAEAGTARWCWSVDQEEYFDAESEAQAHGAAMDCIECNALEKGVERAYWIARQRPAEDCLSLRWFGEDIVEHLSEWLEQVIAVQSDAVALSTHDITDLAALVVTFVRLRDGFKSFAIAQQTVTEHRHTVGAE